MPTVPTKTTSAPGTEQRCAQEPTEEAEEEERAETVDERRTQRDWQSGQDAGQAAGDGSDDDGDDGAGQHQAISQERVQLWRGIQEDGPQVDDRADQHQRGQEGSVDRARGCPEQGGSKSRGRHDAACHEIANDAEGDEQGRLSELDDAYDERPIGEDRDDADQAEVDGDRAT
jgi:hypothetical protein